MPALNQNPSNQAQLSSSKNNGHTARPNRATWLIALAIFTFVGIVISSILRVMTPPETTITVPESPIMISDLDDTATQFNNVELEGSYSQPAQTSNIYQAEIQQGQSLDLLNSAVSKIMSQYRMQQVYSEGKTSIYSGETHTLFVDFDRIEIIFTTNSPPKTTNVDLELSLQSSQDFLKFLLPELSLSPIKQQVKYYKGDQHLESASRIESNVVEIPFSYFLNQLPFYYHQEVEAPVRILLDGTDEIQKITVRFYAPTYTASSGTELITIEQALENINQRHLGVIIQTIEDNPEPLSLDKIRKGKLKFVQLEARFDSQLNLIYPFYRFEGEFVDKNNQNFVGTLITPAIMVAQNN